jgi:5-methylcytosine-specific restriction endonuclease McrA
MMYSDLQRIASKLRQQLSGFEPERTSGPDAARLLEAFVAIEKLAAAGKLLAARRVESSNVWRKDGHRSAADMMARQTGTGLGSAINTLQTARQLGSLPGTEDALREGRLSEAQTREIAGAAIHKPDAEDELVEAAGQQTMNNLKLRCRRVRATADDGTSRYEKIRRGRYLRHWTDNEGAVRFDARMTPDEGAKLVAVVKSETARLAAEGRRCGRHESTAAYAADALVGLAAPSPVDRSTAPSTMVHVRVDHEALLRGHLEPGEICEIPGIGPIPVAAARRLAEDSILNVLVTNGVDVTTVAHAGRTIPASIRRAIIERDPQCVVPGCDVSEGLEIDHVIPVNERGPTKLDNLARLCHWHHYLKTHQGHLLEYQGDHWTWGPPPQAPASTRDSGITAVPSSETQRRLAIE